MTKQMKRLLSAFLCLVLIVCTIPVLENPSRAATGYDRGYQGKMAGDGTIYAHGLDVSAWQGSGLNFQNFANAGYTYVILRIGTSYGKDNCFEEYYNSAKAAGLNVGCYYYSYASNVATAQAEAYDVLSWMNGKLFEYPIYFDYEDPSQSGHSGNLSAQICYGFMDVLKHNGYLTGLYSMASWLEQDWVTSSGIRDTYEGWTAHVLTETEANSGITSDVYYYYHSRYSTRYGMFQYSWTTWVNGCGPFDANVAYKDYPTIVQAYGFNGYHGFNLLDGYEPVDLGKDFYAYVKQTATGRYWTHKNGNLYVREGLDDNGAQMFRFVRQASGAYSVGLIDNSLWMDVTNSDYSNGTNIRMYTGNGSDAQKFYIYYIGGRFVFRTMYNSRVVDVDASSSNIQLWGGSAGDNGTVADARGFDIYKLNMDGTNVNTCIGWDFTCYIRHKETGTLLTAVGDNALFKYPTYSEDQKWRIIRNEYGGNVIQSVVNGKVLDVEGASLDNLANINLYAPNGTKAQSFFVIPQGYSSYWYIKPSYTNTVMSIDGATGEVYSYGFGTTDSVRVQQQFEIISEDHLGSAEGPVSPVYMGESFVAQLHAHGENTVMTDQGDKVAMVENTQAENQFWTFTYDADTNAYQITGSSGKVFDCASGGYKNNTKIVLSESNDTLSQRFRFYDGEYGYTISPAHAQRLLDVATDSTTLQLYRSTVDSTRLFDLTVVSYNGLMPLDLGESFTSTIENMASGLYVAESSQDPLKGSSTPTEWKFTRKSNGAYTVTSASTGKALEVSGGRVSTGTGLKTYTANGTRAQDYFIYCTENGYVLMSSKSVNVLDMGESSKELHIYGWSDSEVAVAAQSFALDGAPRVQELVLKEETKLAKDDDGFLKNLSVGMTAADVIGQFENQGLQVLDHKGQQVQADAPCGTGYTVQLIIGGKITDSVEIVIAGDVDGNTQVDVTDYMRIRSTLLGSFRLDGVYRLAGDVDGSGVIDTTDYMRVRGYFLGTYNLYS